MFANFTVKLQLSIHKNNFPFLFFQRKWLNAISFQPSLGVFLKIVDGIIYIESRKKDQALFQSIFHTSLERALKTNILFLLETSYLVKYRFVKISTYNLFVPSSHPKFERIKNQRFFTNESMFYEKSIGLKKKKHLNIQFGEPLDENEKFEWRDCT